MIARAARARSGITLTEILIAILIMGVGLISLATLFPLGLLRLREATRYSRASTTFETAADDMDTRVLFYKPSFTQTWYWTKDKNANTVPRDPFVQDANAAGGMTGVIASGSNQIFNDPGVGVVNLGTINNVGLTSGLPFCYDPLWRSISNVMPNTGLADPTLNVQASYVNNVAPDEARFGAALFGAALTNYGVRAQDPDGNGQPSAHGLQRLTNFIPWVNANLTASLNYQFPFTTTNAFYQQQYATTANPNYLQPADVTGNVFTSNDDIVFNPFTGNPNSASPLLPDMTLNNTPQADYRFTWFVTGHQVDAGGNGSQFSGEVVVCDGRQFGWDIAPGQSFHTPAGETVVEAIYGYGKINANATAGFANGSDRSVLLRWPAALADPQVRVGGWICDVTYERSPQLYKVRKNNSTTTFVRCYWYQVAKRSEPQADTLGDIANYRSMVLTLTSPVRVKTVLNANGTPYNVNVALVMPSVINVFPRAFEAIPIYTP